MNLTGLHADDEYDVTEQFLDAVATRIQPFVCCCGFLGNVLILVVWAHYHSRQSADSHEAVVHLGLSVMAVSDLLFCVCMLPRVVIKESLLYVPAKSFALYYQLYSQGLITLFGLSSTWSITLTAGIRYVAICHPLKARYVVNIGVVAAGCGAIILLCVLGSLPTFWIYTASPLPSNGTVQMVIVELGPFSHEHSRGKVYMYLRALIAVFLPLILLCYLNICLMRALKESAVLHGRHVSVSSSSPTIRNRDMAKVRLTRTLVAAIVMFVVLVCPCEIMDFFAYVTPTQITVGEHKQAFVITRAVANTMLMSNFAFNFVLYCAVNSTFRKEFTALLLRPFRRCCRRLPGHYSESTIPDEQQELNVVTTECQETVLVNTTI